MLLGPILIFVVSAQPGETDIAKRVAEALTCKPTAEHLCATVDDGLGVVESSMPRVSVLSAYKTEKGIRAWVARSRVALSDGAVFQYEFGPDWKVRSRICYSGVPQKTRELSELPLAHLSFMLGSWTYEDVCRREDECGAFGYGRDFVMSEGKAVDEGGRKFIAIPGAGASCYRAGEIIKLPALPVKILEVKSPEHAFWVRKSGPFPSVKPGESINDGAEILTMGAVRLDVQVGSLRIRFLSDDRPRVWRVRLVEELNESWEAMAKEEIADRTFTWTFPYLRTEDSLFELSGRKAQRVCEDFRERTRETGGFDSLPSVFDGHWGLFYQAGLLTRIECTQPSQPTH